jgi:hypothetical protein
MFNQQNAKLKEQDKVNRLLLKEKEELQATIRELKARIKEGEVSDGSRAHVVIEAASS